MHRQLIIDPLRAGLVQGSAVLATPMQLPFTAEQFFAVFHAYNVAVWPAQVLLLALALVALALIVVPRRGSGMAISAILAFLWLWMGLAYHLAFFTAINPLAYGFAILSAGGGLIFLWHGVIQRNIQFRLAFNARSIIGVVLVFYALVVYPLWSVDAGHHYPALPTFGLPCPTTIFTVGVLAFAVPPYAKAPLIIPVLWCLVGVQAAFFLGVPQDLGLAAAALAGVLFLVRSRAPMEENTAGRARGG